MRLILNMPNNKSTPEEKLSDAKLEQKITEKPAFSVDKERVESKEKSGENQPKKKTPPVQPAEEPKRKINLSRITGRKPIPQIRDREVVQIEKILESGLDDSYQRLSPIAKQEFKLRGEQTSLKIKELLKNSHIKAKKIFKLILDWLKILPGVNKFFLEQEAKIKTDRILALKNKDNQN